MAQSALKVITHQRPHSWIDFMQFPVIVPLNYGTILHLFLVTVCYLAKEFGLTYYINLHHQIWQCYK